MNQLTVKRKKTTGGSSSCPNCGLPCPIRGLLVHMEECTTLESSERERNRVDEPLMLADVEMEVNAAQWDDDEVNDGDGFESPIFLSLVDFVGTSDPSDLKKLLLFYEIGRPLSADTALNRRSLKVIQVAGGKTIMIPNYRPKISKVKNLQKKFERLLNKYKCLEIYTARIRVGPLIVTTDLIKTYMASTVNYRSLDIVLQSWLSDISWYRQAYIATYPLESPPNCAARTYAEAAQFKRVYNGVKLLYPTTPVFVMPLQVWSDGVQLFTKQKVTGVGHPIVLSCPLASTISGEGNLRCIGFMNVDESVTTKNSITNAILKQQVYARVFALLFQDIERLQHSGGKIMNVFGKQMRVIPFLSCFVGDLVESRRTTPSLNCPYCPLSEGSPLGQRFDLKRLSEIQIVEEEQEAVRNNVETDISSHRQFYKDNNETEIKPILSFREILSTDHLYGFSPALPDMLHTLMGGVAKRLINLVHANLKPRFRGKFERRLSSFASYPRNLIQASTRSCGLGVEYSTATVLLPICLRGKAYLKPAFSETIINALDCIGLLLLIAGSDQILDIDKNLLYDAIGVLSEILPYLFKKTHALTHVLINHLFSDSLLKEFGAPITFGTSRFEKSLGNMKESLTKASNHPRNWTEILLKRAQAREMLSPHLSGFTTFDPRVQPVYQRIIFLGNRLVDGTFSTLDIGFADSSRGNMTYPFRDVLLRCDSRSGRTRFPVIQYEMGNEQCFGVIKKIRAFINDIEVCEEDYYLTNIEGFRCDIHVTPLHPKPLNLEQRKRLPHQGLWILCLPTVQEVVVGVEKVTGACFKTPETNEIWVCTSKLSHYLSSISPSVVQSPDVRFDL
jgi:hypothetical protein